MHPHWLHVGPVIQVPHVKSCNPHCRRLSRMSLRKVVDNQWSRSHILMCHVPHIVTEYTLQRTFANNYVKKYLRPVSRGVSQIYMHHVPHMNKSYLIYEGVMQYTLTQTFANIYVKNRRRLLSRRVSQILMHRVSHMNKSCPIYKRVMQYIPTQTFANIYVKSRRRPVLCGVCPGFPLHQPSDPRLALRVCHVLQCVVQCVWRCVLQCGLRRVSNQIRGLPCVCVTCCSVCCSVCCDMCCSVCCSVCLSVMCALRQIHVCKVSHSYVGHDSFIYLTWLIHMEDASHPIILDVHDE